MTSEDNYIPMSQYFSFDIITLWFTLVCMSPVQSVAARALLGWSQDDLASRARVGKSTVADFERGARKPIRLVMDALEKAFDDGGVSFDLAVGKGPGVRLKK